MAADPPPSRPEGPDPGLDVDAAFADIVAHFGPHQDPGPEPAGDPGPDPEGLPPGRAEPPTNGPVQRPVVGPGSDADREPKWREPLQDEATWDDEGHFVPPPPPPLPVVEPRRLLAWIGLFGSPVVALVFLVLQVAIGPWLSLALVCAFVGGFTYLVATMSSSPRDRWTGDDGAVL